MNAREHFESIRDDLTVVDLCQTCADDLRRWLERKGE